MIIYKKDLNTDIYYDIGFVILLGVAVPLSSKFSNSNSSWIILAIFLLLFIVFNSIISRLNEIQLDKTNSSLTLIKKNYIGVKNVANYDLRSIEFTYKKQAVSFRSGMKDTCTIYSKGKQIIKLVQDQNDWSKHEIKRFVEGLIEAGIKNK